MAGVNLHTQRNVVTRRASPLALSIEQFMLRFARRRMGESLKLGHELFKQDERQNKEVEELRRILIRFGVRQMGTATKRVGMQLPSGIVNEAIERKPVRIKSVQEWLRTLDERTRRMVTITEGAVGEAVRRIVRNALSETPKPPQGEIARRIREALTGPEGKRIPGLSFRRASVIARTESLQAENTGIYAGMEETGIQKVQWLSFQFPKFDRRHDKMHKVETDVSTPFTLPSGVRIRYPGDPLAPIGETINCRCTLRPVRR